MNLTNLVTGSVDKIVDSVSDGLDNLFTSDHEKLQAKNKLEEIRSQVKIEMQVEANKAEQIAQENVTKRWNIDKDGNLLTRSIRPLTLAYLLVIVTILALTDGNINGFEIKSEWVDLFKQAFLVVLGAFFIGKSIERVKGKVI